MPSLTLAEARVRAALLTVERTDVELDIIDEAAFRSTSHIEFSCATPGAGTFLELTDAKLVSATLNGAPLDAKLYQDDRLELPGLAAQNVVEVDAILSYSHNGEGLHAHQDPVDGRRYVYGMSFLDAAPRWFACFDQPDLKCDFRFQVTAPAEWTVLGNGPASVIDEPQGGRTWEFATNGRISTYLTTVVAGELESVTTEHDGIVLGLHAKKSMAEELHAQAPGLLQLTGECFDDYHDLFGVRYPFGDYHQAFVADFNAGAMENPGCVLLREGLLFRGAVTEVEVASRAATVAHEMAHMWFGDLVTMRWWDDLWLNESFAEYLAHRVVSARGRFNLWTDFGISRKHWGTQADRSPSTHPVAESGAADTDAALMNFDGISYAKGAALLKQLAKRLGDDTFLGGLRTYFAQFAFDNASMADLLAHWDAAGAIELDAWATAWLTTMGMDEIAVVGGDIVVTGPDGDDTPREHAVDLARLADDGTELQRSSRMLVAGRQPAPAGDGRLVPDAGDDAWAILRILAPGESPLALPRISRVADPSTRVALWSSVRWAVRDALADPRDALALILREVPEESEEALCRDLLQFAEGLVAVWLPAAERPRASDAIAALLAQQLPAHRVGSDRRLTLLRSQLATTHDAGRLESFLAGAEGETSTDPELRWRAIGRLAALTGATGAVDAELERDHTAMARSHAARARATVGTLSAKEAALAVVLGDPDIAPHELYATGEGLFEGEGDALLEPFAVRWCQGVAELDRVRRGWVLGKSAAASFPYAVATPAVLAAARQALDGHLAPAVRRVVVDGVHRLEIVRASREAFPPRGAATGE